MSSPTRLSRMRSENSSGFVTMEFLAGVALLLLPVTLLVLTLPTWWQRFEMSQVASREAAREYVLTGSATQAQQVVSDIQTNYGIPANGMTLVLSGNPLTRGGSVVAKVTTRIPGLEIPVWNIPAVSFDITTTHSEPIDLYRSEG